MSKGKVLAVALVWLLIVAAIAVAYRLIWVPRRQQATMAGTSSPSRYQNEINFAVDSFSGYAILRSPQFKEELASKRIRLALQDDGADYPARLRAMDRGDIQMGVFTIDALLATSAELGRMPATIVAIVDETRGADAMVAYQELFPNVDALNRADVRFVLARNSPSETLTRVVMSHFRLDSLPSEPFLHADNMADVMEQYRRAKPTDPSVFVAWEPYVSRLLENPKMHIVTDSAAFRGYIVDVIVTNRDFLLKNESTVRDVVGCYFKAAYANRDQMVELLQQDARQLGTPLTPAQAQRLVEGIWWKNTLENFAHFGVDSGSELQPLEDMVLNLTNVLRRTGAIASDPTHGQPQLLFFDKILRDLRASDFHPRLSQEQLRDDRVAFSTLSDREWKQLIPIGTLSIPDLVFARGTAILTDASQKSLDDLIRELDALPTAYLVIRGNAALQGDLEANRRLAEQRAQAVQQYLVRAGVASQRVRAQGVDPEAGPTVSLLLGRTPY